ncbi:hypothetical protein CLV86_1850 [Lacinutrix venerupis]|nr:class I lanthipeptide [Lacinutrix venerupis]RLJ63313.1 hypothetical protein CLV86_1850 [Lacinutrix venerupis]
MKTQDNKLKLNKNSLIELNIDSMATVNGGSWTVIIDPIKEKIKTITQ